MRVPRGRHTRNAEPQQGTPHAKDAKARLKAVHVFQPRLRGGLKVVVIPRQRSSAPSHDVSIAPNPDPSPVSGQCPGTGPRAGSALAPCSKPALRAALIGRTSRFDGFAFQRHGVRQARPSTEHAGEGFVHGTRKRAEAWPFGSFDQAVKGQLDIGQPNRHAVVRSTPKRRRPKALFHRGQRVVPSTLHGRRGPGFQGCKHTPCGSELVAKVEGPVQRYWRCLWPHEQGLMAVHGAPTDGKLHTPCGGHGVRAVGMLGQRGERAARSEGTQEKIVRAAVMIREEPATVPISTNRFHGRAGDLRSPPHAGVVVEQVLQGRRHHRDRPPRRRNRALRRLRKEARRPRCVHDGTRKVPRVNPALGVRIPQGQGRAR